jgi:hypothetical protein
VGQLSQWAVGRLLVGFRERRAVDQIGFTTHIVAVGIAGVRDHAILVAGLGFAPARHDLDRCAERIFDGAAGALGLVGPVRVGWLVAARELLLGDDVLLAGRIGDDPVALIRGVGRFRSAACELGFELFASRASTSPCFWKTGAVLSAVMMSADLRSIC